MAVAFDNCTNATSFSSTASWSHACTGSDLVLYVGIAIDAASNFNPSVTYNSVSMTQLDEVTTNRYLTVFRLVNPATGSNTVAVSGLPGGGEEICIAVSLTGVDQTTPNDAVVTTNGSSPTSCSINVDTATGDLVLDFIALNSTAGTSAGGSQTIPTNGSVDGSSSEMATSYMTGNGTVSPSWSWTSATHAQYGFNVNASGGSGGGGEVSGTPLQDLSTCFGPARAARVNGVLQ